MPTVLQSSSGQKCKTTSVQSLYSQFYGGRVRRSWGVVNANGPLLLRVGVGFLTAGGGPSGGVSCNGAGDLAVACCLTPRQWPGRGSLGGCGL